MRAITSYQHQQDTVIQTFEYNGTGNLIREILYPDKSLFKVTTEYGTYDVFGHPRTVSVKAKDKDGLERTRTTSQSYTASGRFVASQTDGLGKTTHYQWNETRGLLQSETDPWGRVTSHTYDNWGTRKETCYPDGTRTAAVLRWAGSGAPAGTKYYSYTQRSGNAPVLTWFDGFGRELQRDAWGLNNKKVSISTEYYTSGTNQGRLYRISEPYFENETRTWAVTYNAYDRYGRNTVRITPMGQTSFLYNGRTTTVTTPEGSQSTTRNTSGFTESSTVNGKSVTYTYYPNGLTKTATPDGTPTGQELKMEYDLHGNRTKLIDPDAGEVLTRYNGFGEVVEAKQKIHHANAWNITTNHYSSLGLLQSTVLGNDTIRYLYDMGAGYPARVKSIEIPGRHTQTFTYDALSRITNLREVIDDKIIDKGVAYDVLGRVKRELYPGGYYTENHYDSNGFLTQVTDRAGRNVWQVLEESSKGQMLREKKGSRIITYNYDARGFPIYAYASGVLDIVNQFDTAGNLIYRDDYVTGSRTEYMSYDGLNRLKSWGSVGLDSMVYDAPTCNIRIKNDLGSYTMDYGANGKPHALTSISGLPDSFPVHNLSISYTDFKKIKTLTEGVKSYTLTYGVDDQRRKSVYKENNAAKETRYYFGSYEEKTDHTLGVTEKIHYLGPAIYIERSNGTSDFYQAYYDYQGSLIALERENGMQTERYAYDPWGRRRNPSNWSQSDSRTGRIVNRGYTMHEHIDPFGLINMNGRAYDPVTAQFLSPDPYIQSPGNWLNYNRYSYCLNNPFKYTDPSGNAFAVDDLIVAIVMASVMNIHAQNMAGNLHSSSDLWKAAAIGAVAGLAGYGVGALVSNTIKIGGFIGGALIGGAGGAAGNFVAGAGNAWGFKKANFRQGLKAGLIGGGIGALTSGLIGGLTRGISDYRNGYSFWDGSKYDDVLIGDIVSAGGDVEQIADSYNSSFKAEYDTSILQEKMAEIYGVKEGNFDIEEITTRTTEKKYGLTTEGQYYKLSEKKVVGGYIISNSGSQYVSLHVSPYYIQGDAVLFKAVAGHELIHAYHNYAIPNFSRIFSERVAYKYSVDVLAHNGRFSAAMSLLNEANNLSYWGVYPSQYGILPYRLYLSF